jgi:glycine cleavage system H protein
MNVAGDRRYTTEHEWALEQGGAVQVGISDFAQHELGDIVFADLPQVGTEVVKGKAFATVESVKAVSEVYAPLDGVVAARNEALQQSPELINSAPYSEGWMVTITPKDQAQLATLMSSAEYEKHLQLTSEGK